MNNNLRPISDLVPETMSQVANGNLPIHDTRRQYVRKQPRKFILPKRCRFKMTVSYRYGTPLYLKHEKKGGKAIYHSYDLKGEKPVILNEKQALIDLKRHVKENIRQIQKARIYMSTDLHPDPRTTDYHIEVFQYYRKLGAKSNPTLLFQVGTGTTRFINKWVAIVATVEETL